MIGNHTKGLFPFVFRGRPKTEVSRRKTGGLFPEREEGNSPKQYNTKAIRQRVVFLFYATFAQQAQS